METERTVACNAVLRAVVNKILPMFDAREMPFTMGEAIELALEVRRLFHVNNYYQLMVLSHRDLVEMLMAELQPTCCNGSYVLCSDGNFYYF